MLFNKVKKEKKIREIQQQIKVLEYLGEIYGCDPEFEPEKHPWSSNKLRTLRDELYTLTNN